jgi:ADP-heptose:LPS heptosyltransferase
VLVLRPGALGDTLLAVPALRALWRAFAPLTLAAHPAAARLLASLGEIDRGLAFDDPSLAWLFTGRPVPDEPIVAWMNTPLQHATLVAPSRPSNGEHCARYLLETLAPLGIDLTFDDHPLGVTPTPADEVLIHPGSGSPGKNWPAAKFAAVIRALDAPVRLIVGEADARAAADVEAHLSRALPRLEHPPLEELAARLAGCRAYLGNDSGVSHLAGLCGAYTVTLFGPTNPDIWRPLGPRVEVLTFDASANQVAERLTA